MTVPILAVTLNVAFLLEIKEENTELDRLLTETRAAASKIAAQGANWRQVMELLESLRDNVTMQFVLEEAYGYFENPAFYTPELGASAALLRDEHWILCSELKVVIAHVEERVHNEVLDMTPLQIAQELIAFCDDLLYHDTQEYALILSIQESNAVAS